MAGRVPVLVLPPIPKDPADDLIEWFVESDDVFKALKDRMLLSYLERIERLNGMAKQAGEVFWWPFTQHKLVHEEAVTVIDSRCGETFSVYKVCMRKYFFFLKHVHIFVWCGWYGHKQWFQICTSRICDS